MLKIFVIFILISAVSVSAVLEDVRSACDLKSCVVKRFTLRNFQEIQEGRLSSKFGGCDNYFLITDMLKFRISRPLCCCKRMDDVRLYERILGYQSEIQANNDIFPPAGVEDFKVVKGSRNIVFLSAPHATRQIRDGSVKDADYCTGAIARIVGELTGSSVIYTSYKSALDPNYVDFADGKLIPFKQAIADLARAGVPAIILDIHGASETQSFDVDFGTMRGKSLLGKNNVLLEPLKTAFRSQNIADLSSDFFAAEQQLTVTRFSSEHLGIPAVQLEINRKYRCRTQEDTVRLVDALTAFIVSLAG